jgi:protein-disulfide isomerase/uncharacterized membrane protein
MAMSVEPPGSPADSDARCRRFAIALGFLGVSSVASLLLALEHLGALQLPGCGPGGGCARAAASAWGRLPLVEWPVAFVGLAYFAGLFAARWSGRDRMPESVRRIADVGAMASIVYGIVLIVERTFCGYCLAAHAGNLAFWIHMRRSDVVRARSFRRSSLWPLVVGVLTASGVTGGLSVTREWIRARAQRAEESALALSIENVIAHSSQKSDLELGGSDERRFEGRYPTGPTVARARIVIFMDYQCAACLRIDHDVAEALATHADVRLSIKHFPMCGECNARVQGAGPHPNACWAARAAEAAGIVAGRDGFWRMHRWLVAHDGAFSEATLQAGAAEVGIEPGELSRMMAGQEALERVRADVEEGVRLGVGSTPTIFVDGVELRGRLAEHAVPRAIEAILSSNRPLESAAGDVPAAASGTVAGLVAGETVSIGEVEQAVRTSLDRLEFERYRLERATLDGIALERLLTREACARGVTIDTLRRLEIANRVAEPSRAEIEEVYTLNPQRSGGRPLDDVGAEIAEALRVQRRHEREALLFSELTAKYGYRVELLPPRMHVDVPPTAPTRGDPDARVTIVEFADFECPHCRDLQPTLARLLAQHAGEVRLCFLDLPLSAHSRARAASTAARSAGEQGRYWDYFDSLMSQPGDLGDADLERRASALGLDAAAFRASFASGRHTKAIEADLREARDLGVSATPTLFINGRPWVGALSYEELEAAVERELVAQRGDVHSGR